MAQGVSEGQIVADRYQLVKMLGEGGMGQVWIASHTATSRRVALKVILPDKAIRDNPTALSRFQREAVALGKIDSPYVTQVLDAGTDAATGAAFLVMELFQGEDVEKLIERLGPLPPQLALRVAFQALQGLQAAHDAGIVHRDIKPANLFLSKRAGFDPIVKVLDFGIVKLAGDQEHAEKAKHLTATGMVFGSLPYMSPEQLQATRSVDARTDVWSIGVTLYQALSGRSPFLDVPDLGAIVLKICTGAPPPLLVIAPWVSADVAALVDRAMRRDLSERFQSAAEMAGAITQLLFGPPAISEQLLVSLPEGVRSLPAARAVPQAAAPIPPQAGMPPQPQIGMPPQPQIGMPSQPHGLMASAPVAYQTAPAAPIAAGTNPAARFAQSAPRTDHMIGGPPITGPAGAFAQTTGASLAASPARPPAASNRTAAILIAVVLLAMAAGITTIAMVLSHRDSTSLQSRPQPPADSASSNTTSSGTAAATASDPGTTATTSAPALTTSAVAPATSTAVPTASAKVPVRTAPHSTTAPKSTSDAFGKGNK